MLENTVYCLKRNKKLTIGYFGGSITEGMLAPGNTIMSYRIQVNEWFRQQCPEAEIREVQAAISGTGTQLGMHRCEDDLLKGDPDLIFIEFAVNDYGQCSYEQLAAQVETILRKAYAKNPYTDVVFLYTTMKEICDSLEKGGEYTSRSAHTAVAHHYGLPMIDIGTVMWTEVLRSGGDFLQYTSDTIHPNAAGYALYSDTICSFLSQWLNMDTPNEMKKIVLPERTFCPKLHMNAHIEDCTQLDGLKMDGFTVSGKTLCGRYPRYIESATPGDSFSFTFTGENAGFYWIKANDSGDVLVSVDGGEDITVRSWDFYCPGGPRAAYNFFAENLEYGVHTVVVRIAETKAEESKGTAIRIGAILVS
ncbi:MAG: SGNH/GDSL hydrolase family protein [Clostridia bacterium]|nr:SGNH/GDSL hydrolase family protein [Clostridia bacterium]